MDLPNSQFVRQYKCLSFALARQNSSAFEEGDKSTSALSALSVRNIEYPLVFAISSRRCPELQMHCGVLEFTAAEGTSYLPHWMMENLRLEEEDMVEVKNVRLPKGSFVSFRPLEEAFVRLSNPRVVLETKLRFYSCLTKNTTIVVSHLGVAYRLQVFDLQPADAVSIFETDLLMEFNLPEAEQTRGEGEAAFDRPESVEATAGAKPVIKIGKQDGADLPPKPCAGNMGAQGMSRWSEEAGGFRYIYEIDPASGKRRLMKREEIREDWKMGKGNRL